MEAQISEFLQALRAYANRSEAQLKMEAQYSENLQALAAIIKGKPEVEVDSNSRQEVGDPTPSPPLLVQATQGAFQEVAPAISLDDAPISPAGGVAVLQPHGVTAPEVLGITPSPAAVAKKVPVVVHMTSAAAEEVLKDVPDGSLDHISMAPITCSTKSLNQLGPSPPSSTTEATPPWVFTPAVPSLTAKGTALRSTPWPFLTSVPADGDETRPMPWPSFAYYHQGMLLLQSRLQPHGIYLEPSKCEPHVSSFCSAISDDLPVNCSCAKNFDQRQAALICCDGKILCFDTVYNAKSGEYVSPSIGIKAMDHRYCSCLSGKSPTQNSVGPLSYALIDAPCSEYSSQALAPYISSEDTMVNRNYPEAIQFSLSLLSSAQCQWLIPWFVDGVESATIVPCISYWRYWTCFIPCLSYGAEVQPIPWPYFAISVPPDACCSFVTACDSNLIVKGQDGELANTSLPTRLSHTGEFGCKTSKEWYKFGNVNGNSGFRMQDTVQFFPDSKNWLSEHSACLVLIAVELHYSSQATASENLFGTGQRLDKLSTETFRSCGIQLLQFEQYVSQGLLFCAIQVMQSLQPKPPWLYSAPASITVRCQYKSILEGINSATGTEHHVIYSVFTSASGHDSMQGTRNFLQVSQKMNGEAAQFDQFAVGYPFFSDMAHLQWEIARPLSSEKKTIPGVSCVRQDVQFSVKEVRRYIRIVSGAEPSDNHAILHMLIENTTLRSMNAMSNWELDSAILWEVGMDPLLRSSDNREILYGHDHIMHLRLTGQFEKSLVSTVLTCIAGIVSWALWCPIWNPGIPWALSCVYTSRVLAELYHCPFVDGRNYHHLGSRSHHLCSYHVPVAHEIQSAEDDRYYQLSSIHVFCGLTEIADGLLPYSACSGLNVDWASYQTAWRIAWSFIRDCSLGSNTCQHPGLGTIVGQLENECVDSANSTSRTETSQQ